MWKLAALAFYLNGSHDGDVSSFQGLSQYNRFRFTRPGPAFKSAIWMYRANHGQWNTGWNNRDQGTTSSRALQLDALIDGESQRQFGRVVIGGFLEATLHGNTAYQAMFRDHRAAGDWLPPTMYLTRYADANTRLLATFDEDVDVTTGSLPGVRISAESLSTWKENDTPSRSRNTTFRSNAVTLGWNNAPVGPDTVTPRWPARLTLVMTDSMRATLPLDTTHALVITVGTSTAKPGPRKVPRDTTKRPADSAAATPRAKAAATPKKPAVVDSTPPDFSLELEDAAGRTARVPLSAFGPVRRPIESYIYRRRGRDTSQFAALAEGVMYTYVAPLGAFSRANAVLDLASVRAVRLVFDRTRSGTVTVDDVGFTRGGGR